mmetsp:Transcript_3437/g.3397  ORF Transcript_3437/g.3397 Transcript_3437/m.3397 type:complete len:273 (+) Transcript_3437:738-1556(+)
MMKLLMKLIHLHYNVQYHHLYLDHQHDLHDLHHIYFDFDFLLVDMKNEEVVVILILLYQEEDEVPFQQKIQNQLSFYQLQYLFDLHVVLQFHEQPIFPHLYQYFLSLLSYYSYYYYHCYCYYLVEDLQVVYKYSHLMLVHYHKSQFLIFVLNYMMLVIDVLFQFLFHLLLVVVFQTLFHIVFDHLLQFDLIYLKQFLFFEYEVNLMDLQLLPHLLKRNRYLLIVHYLILRLLDSLNYVKQLQIYLYQQITNNSSPHQNHVHDCYILVLLFYQ